MGNMVVLFETEQFCKTNVRALSRMFEKFLASESLTIFVKFIGLFLQVTDTTYLIQSYSRTPLIRPPSESHWCGRIRGMVAREGFVYEQKPLSVTRNVVV